MPRLTPEQQIACATKKKAKAEETIRRAKKALRDTDRKKDTRKKIILGATLFSLAESDLKARRIIDALVSHMSDRDRELFD